MDKTGCGKCDFLVTIEKSHEIAKVAKKNLCKLKYGKTSSGDHNF